MPGPRACKVRIRGEWSLEFLNQCLCFFNSLGVTKHINRSRDKRRRRSGCPHDLSEDIRRSRIFVYRAIRLRELCPKLRISRTGILPNCPNEREDRLPVLFLTWITLPYFIIFRDLFPKVRVARIPRNFPQALRSLQNQHRIHVSCPVEAE